MIISETIERKILRVGILLGLLYQIYQTITSLSENGLINNTSLINIFVTIIFLILFGFTYTKIPTPIPAAGIHLLLMPVFYYFWINYGGIAGTVPDFLCVYFGFIISTLSGSLLVLMALIYIGFIYGLTINPFLTDNVLINNLGAFNDHLTFDYFIVASIIIIHVDFLKRQFNSYREKSDSRIKQIALVAESQTDRNLSLLTKQEEINQLNASLQQQINDRVQVQEHQREILEKYAFMNAHLLRAPVCRILGLINLIKAEKGDFSPELAELESYAQEIDRIAKKINEVITHDDH